MMQAFIALGTNIEPREQHLTEALESLVGNKSIVIESKSSIYETAPVGYTDQADFLNMVIEVKTSLSGIDLLDICQEIERHLGRKRTIRFGPRTIDLDILVYNQENSKTERLTLPHPRMHERAFVLIPLQEIAPQLVIAAIKKSVVELIADLPGESVDDVRKFVANKTSKESWKKVVAEKEQLIGLAWYIDENTRADIIDINMVFRANAIIAHGNTRKWMYVLCDRLIKLKVERVAIKENKWWSDEKCRKN